MTQQVGIKSTLLLGALPLVLAFGLIPKAWTASAKQWDILPGSAARGQILLKNAGCLGCHSLRGTGENDAPDLAVSSKRSASPELLASALWNHGPALFDGKRADRPPLKSSDVADLFAYLYASFYIGPRGDARKGADIFTSKNCAGCHSEILDSGNRRSIRQTWMDVKDPGEWAENMWNHAAQMDSTTSNRGLPWPRMSESEISDLMAFLSSRDQGETPAEQSFAIGEPEAGEGLFDKSCGGCHSFGDAGKQKIDLLKRSGPASLAGYIAAMWNHAPAMRRRSDSLLELRPGQMSDLIAYLFTRRYFSAPGDADKGRRAFESLRCATCHESRRGDTGAPDLSKFGQQFSPITLSAAAWLHGPGMTRAMVEQRLSWPAFKGSDMADLIAYLNKQLIPRVAK